MTRALGDALRPAPTSVFSVAADRQLPSGGLPMRHLLSVGLLPSGIKQWIYRRRGYRIGRNVRIAPGAIVVGRDVHIGDGVTIGPGTIIRADRIRLERGASIGRGTVISGRAVSLGEDSQVEGSVWVSSGAIRPESVFSLGAFTILMRHSYVNCLHEVRIGDGSGIGGHCLIFTHGYWLNWFQGYPRQVAPVSIGRDVWLPWRVFVMPGARIGDRCVIGANSLVSGSIPDGRLAAGSPAKVVEGREYTGILAEEEVSKRVQAALDDFMSLLAGLGADVVPGANADARREHAVLVGARESLPPATAFTRSHVVLSLQPLTDEWIADAARQGVSWFDMTRWQRSDRTSPLASELVAHFQGYGVRFRRC